MALNIWVSSLINLTFYTIISAVRLFQSHLNPTISPISMIFDILWQVQSSMDDSETSSDACDTHPNDLHIYDNDQDDFPIA